MTQCEARTICTLAPTAARLGPRQPREFQCPNDATVEGLGHEDGQRMPLCDECADRMREAFAESFSEFRRLSDGQQ